MGKTKKKVEETVEEETEETTDSDLGAEEKVTEEVTEEETQEESKEEPKEETQEDKTSEDDFFPKTDEDSEEESTSSDSEEDATSKEDDGQKETELGLEDDLSVDDFDIDKKEEKKSGVQKRIDQLVAEKKSLEERLEKVEQTSTGKLPDYSESQLRTAMNKAMEEGDANLMWEIMDYRVKKEKSNVLEANKKRQQEQLERQKKVAQEWHSTVEEYEYLSDNDEPEIYTGSHKDLNIKDKNSLLMQLATTLYQDPGNAERYQKDGGQRLAISDAIRMILRKRNTKASSKENKKLKRKLAKEKRKSSVASGSSVKKKKDKPTTSGNSLEDYIKERKKLQHTGL